MMTRFFRRSGPIVPGSCNSIRREPVPNRLAADLLPASRLTMPSRGQSRVVRHEDVALHDAARRAPQRRSTNHVMGTAPFDLCFRLHYTGRMTDADLMVIERFAPRHLMDNSSSDAARHAGAGRTCTSISLVHLLHVHQPRNQINLVGAHSTLGYIVPVIGGRADHSQDRGGGTFFA